MKKGKPTKNLLRNLQMITVEIPRPLLAEIDAECQRLGVSRQSFIKITMAQTIRKGAEGR